MNLKYYLRGLGIGIVMSAIALGITASGKKQALTEEEIIAKAKDLGMVEEEELEEQIEAARAETEQRMKEEGVLANAAPEADDGMQGMTDETGDTEADGISGNGEEGQEMETPKEQGEQQEDETGQETAVGEGESKTANDNGEIDDAPGTDTGEEGTQNTGSNGQAAQEEGNNSREQGADAESESDGMTERGMSEGEKTVFIVKKGESPYSIGKRMEEEGLLPKDAGFDRYLVDHGYDTKVVAAEYEIPADADMDTIARIITKQTN